MNVARLARVATGSRLAAQIAVVVVFVVSRIYYRSTLHIEFDASPVDDFIQYLDPWFVAHDFWRSVLYLHHQAPLQILFVQGAIKLLGTLRALSLLQGLYVAFGLSLSVALSSVLMCLGAPPSLAALAVCLYVSSPTFILYETWLFYPLPTSLLLVCSLLALLRYYRRGTFGAALLFFSTLAVLSLLRATYGAVFLCAAAALLVAFPALGPSGSARRTILKAAAAPLLVVTLNTAKTSLLVRHPFGTALLWQNLCLKIAVHLPAGERHRLVLRGDLSDAAGYRGLMKKTSEYGRFRVDYAPTGIPLLDFEVVPGGRPNRHALEHVLVADRTYRHDALYLLKHETDTYAKAVWEALSREYVRSTAYADGLAVSANFERLVRVRSALERAAGSLGKGRCVALYIGLPLAWLYGLFRLAGAPAASGRDRTLGIAISYMLLTIGYAAGVTLLISFGDFNRYRFEVDPFYLVLFVLLAMDIGRAARRLGKRLRPRGASSIMTGRSPTIQEGRPFAPP